MPSTTLAAPPRDAALAAPLGHGDRFAMMRDRLFLFAALLGAIFLLTACGPDGINPIGDDDDAASDDDDVVETPVDTVTLAIETTGCGEAIEAQYNAYGFEIVGDIAELPVDGLWRRLDVYGVEFASQTRRVCAVAVDGEVEIYQSWEISSESCADAQARSENNATFVDGTLELELNYNMSAQCLDAEDAGDASCSPALAGNGWYLDFYSQDTGNYALTIGEATPDGQPIYGLPNADAVVQGCRIYFGDVATGDYYLTIDPDGGPNGNGEFTDVEWGDYYGHRL